MSPLQEKMIKAMELRNLAKGTQDYYLLAVKGPPFTLRTPYPDAPITHLRPSLTGATGTGT